MNRQELARLGEGLAEELACSRGYQVLARNFRCRWGEIDLILKLQETVVFVEVKTRRGQRFGAPQESVIMAKQQRVHRVARWYVAQHQFTDCNYRFDVIAVSINGRDQSLKWYENAFW